MTRDELQDGAVERLERFHKLICQWATGCGKSNVALKFILRHPGYRCLIVVPEQNNIENWRDEFSKFGVPLDGVTIICYASLHKHINTSWDLLVLDEMPHADTEKRMRILKTIKARNILALGAVIDDDERWSLESVYGKFDINVVSLKMATRMGILPSPVVYVLHMSLDNVNRDRFIKGKMCTAKEEYDHIQAKVTKAVNDFNVSSSTLNKNRMLKAGNERKKFLGREKQDAIQRVCDRLEEKGRRFICFCSSIKQAEALGRGHSFTSKTPVSLKILERFNSGEIDSIYVVGKLIEGQNLNNIECGVIGQLGGTHRITVQECGRVMRSKKPVIYVPVFDGTKDDSFLYTLTSSIPDECVKHLQL